MHDFAWTTSPDYLDLTETFTHATLPQVTMRLLLQPEHAGQRDRHFAATRAALQYYGEWFGPYPYGHITIVDPAWQSGAGGMEYPTLFTAGTRWLAPYAGNRAGERHGPRSRPSVLVRHRRQQRVRARLARRRTQHLLDGACTRTGVRAELPLSSVFLAVSCRGCSATCRSPARWRAAGAPSTVSPRMATCKRRRHGRYWPGTAGATTYQKTALWLHTLERMLGWETLQRILSTYFRRWAFGIPRRRIFSRSSTRSAGAI